MYILGISALYHDSAVCLLKDGKLIFSASEERFTRKKHDNSFPINAIQKSLEFSSITITEIDLVCFYEKPFQKFERLIDTYSEHSPKGFWSFKKAMKSWFSKKLWIQDIIRKELNYEKEIIFSEHHESHAAGTFYTSPFDRATIVTMDGVGEKSTATIGIGSGNQIEIIKSQHFPHSLGLFYSAITYYCGFKVNSGEYKLMGLAPYGKPIYVELMKKYFITISDEGEVELNQTYFNYSTGLRMTSSWFDKVMGEKRRKPEEELSQFYKDVAQSAQCIVEEVLVKMVKYAVSLTGIPRICLSGGVALNCKANSKLLDFIEPNNCWIQPASGDDGAAIGAAFVGWHHYLKKERSKMKDTPEEQVYLGTSYKDSQVRQVLEENRVSFKELSKDDLLDEVSEQLTDKKIVGWFNGRMEFGPRALGNRSILASPQFEDMKEYLNQKIKLREGFRPFAPVVKEDKMGEWFEMDSPSKYMLFTRKSERKAQLPSCIHEDFSARVQSVNKDDNKLLYDLLDSVEEKSGIPILINTSFNVRGEPIVESPNDALTCFFNTGIDTLVIEGLLIEKEFNSHINWKKSLSHELD